MKKTKIIVPALGMLLLSTAASVTGTVAWFAVNTSVTVTGLKVKAKAEGGILIAPYTLTSASAASDGSSAGYNDTLTDAVYAEPAKADFKNTATVGLAAAELFPTSTATTAAWYHATSIDANNYAANNNYTTFGANLKKDGKNYSGTGADSAHAYAYDGQYFLYNQYRVKATNEVNFSLYVSNITVSAETAASQAINNSLRVAIKVGDGAVKFFAPLYTSSEVVTLKCWDGTQRADYSSITKDKGDLDPRVLIADNTVTSAGIDMKIWVYYEGEDENCKTVNTDGVTVDELTLGFTFTTLAA